jgi:hypothetical protein
MNGTSDAMGRAGRPPAAGPARGGADWSRREAIGRALAGAGGLWFGGAAGRAAAATDAAAAAAPGGTARAVIQLWIWGGPCHLDTFDPKPEAGQDYCGPFATPVETNVPGIRIGEMLPLLAQQADKYAILRGMTHGVNGHETASYEVQTGHKPGGGTVFPCVGAVVSLLKGFAAGYKGLIPPYIVLTRPQGRFSEAGFLGSRAKPFATGGDPAQTPFVVEGVVARGVTEDRQRARRDLRQRLDTLGAAMPGDPRMKAAAACEQQAYDLILGDAGKVFDLSQETDEMRDRYGRSSFGQACLVARRLVERGVPYVTVNYEGWDTHKQHFQAMRRKLPELDRGMSGLLTDLAERGRLDSTIVWWGGEFGRTPKIQWEPPWSGGRNHFGKAFCHVLAGGGFKGGRVVGATDATGSEVVERPIYPPDLIASIYRRLGLAADTKLPHPQGLDIPAMPTRADGTVVPLTEIM